MLQLCPRSFLGNALHHTLLNTNDGVTASLHLNLQVAVDPFDVLPAKQLGHATAPAHSAPPAIPASRLPAAAEPSGGEQQQLGEEDGKQGKDAEAGDESDDEATVAAADPYSRVLVRGNSSLLSLVSR